MLANFWLCGCFRVNKIFSRNYCKLLLHVKLTKPICRFIMLDQQDYFFYTTFFIRFFSTKFGLVTYFKTTSFQIGSQNNFYVNILFFPFFKNFMISYEILTQHTGSMYKTIPINCFQQIFVARFLWVWNYAAGKNGCFFC